MELFQMSRMLGIFFVLICVKEIRGALNHVTTMYKFHRLESDSNDEQYFNTCSVSVHVDNNKLQLPLINMNGDSLLPNTTIPSLYTDQGTSTWFQMRNDNTTLLLPEIQFDITDFSNVPFLIIIDEIRNSYEMDTIGEVTASAQGYIEVLLFQNKEFLKIRENTRTLIEVAFHAPLYFYISLYWENQQGIKITFTEEITICLVNQNVVDFTTCSKTPQRYARNANSISYIAIDITDNITIIDQVASVTHKTPLHVPEKYDGYTRIVQYEYNNYDKVSYKLKQQTSVTLVSPWIDGVYNNQSLFILYSGHGSSLLSVYLDLEDANTSHQIQLDCEEVNRAKNTDGLHIVLTKVNLTATDNWMEQKRIKIIASGDVAIVNVWEGRRLDLYKIQEPQPCVKSNMTDIYNTLDDRTIAQSGAMSHCFNGGRLEDNNSICNCPPGFAGRACETPCGRNCFGSKCSKQCSRLGNECQGVVLCTPEYGCSCAPGYEGDYCSEQCQPGFYGADCTQQCGHCKGECDIYTGHCHEGCNTTYLIRPQCKQSHSYLKSSGKVLGLRFNKIDYQIDFTANNLAKFNDNTLYYMIQYRTNTNSSWDNLTLDDGLNDFHNVFQEGIISERTIDNLESGHIYQFRTILLDEDLETHDPSLTEPFEIELCEGETLKVKSKTNTSIGLSWGPGTEKEPTMCHTKGYILELSQNGKEYLEKERVITTVKNSYEVKNLNPGQSYHIQLKKLINDNDSVPISSINVTTDKVSTICVGVRISKNESAVHIEWFESPIYTTYYVKYKLKKYLPCKKQETSSPLHVATTSDTFYDLELKDLESNALYGLFVTGDIDENVNPQNKYFTSTLNKTTWKCNNTN